MGYASIPVLGTGRCREFGMNCLKRSVAEDVANATHGMDQALFAFGF